MRKVIGVTVVVLMIVIAGIFLIDEKNVDTDITKEKTKVGFVLIGTCDDKSYSQSHYEGMQKTAQRLNLDVIYKECVPTDGQSKEIMQELITEGCEIIVCSSYDYGEEIHMSKLMLVLGNGFTIDLIHQIEKEKEVNTVNLFYDGDIVEWPDGTKEKGFLSYRNCKNLWNLGARPKMDREKAQELIEDIISCANTLPQKMLVGTGEKDNIYIKDKELKEEFKRRLAGEK